MMYEIFLVEDDQEQQFLIKKILEKIPNIMVKIYGRAEDCLKDCLSLKNDADNVIIITGLCLGGGIDGLTFIKQVRINYQSIPIIIFSASLNYLNQTSLPNCNCIHCIPKPELRVLVETVKKIISSTPSTPLL